MSLRRLMSRGATTIPAQKVSTSMVLDDCVFALYESAVMISGLLCAIGITEGLTQCLKMYIGRLRPNMYQLCQFSTVTLQYSTSITKERIREGHLSFPSGHSSLASVSMVYCTWYFLHFYSHWSNTGTLQRRQQSGSDAIYQYSNNDLWTLLLSELRTLIIALFLPGWAVYVGMTRIVDHWHHVSDVLAGLLLGSMIGTITFHTIVPPILQYLKVSLYNTHRIYDVRTDERHNCMSPGLSLQTFNQPITTTASPGSTSSEVPV
jgi:membrane-associated phospholipid phosphatase